MLVNIYLNNYYADKFKLINFLYNLCIFEL